MTTRSARWSGERMRQLAGYGARFVTDPKFRDAWRARAHLRALRRINPDLRVVGVADEGGSTFVAWADSVITPLVIAHGHFQRTDFQRAWDIAGRLAPRPGATVFVDVGANVGTTTLYAQRTGAFRRIVSVEPSPDNLDVLRLNVQANGLDDVVSVVAAACGAQPGTVQLLASTQSSGDHRVRRGEVVPESHAVSVEVPERPLDDILAELGVAPESVALVWVDTQGHEPAVLAGGSATLGAGVPFLMEFWPELYVEAGTYDAHVQAIDHWFRAYIDLREAGELEHPVGDLKSLADRLLAEPKGQTDLLLLPKAST